MKNRVEEILESCGVLLKGHFLLTSGKHSGEYLQCAKVFQYPNYTEELAEMIAGNYNKDQIHGVIGPAIGGIILAYAVANKLGVQNLFAERENGVMTLRRGFTIEKGQRFLVVEDVITTGGSVKEVIDLVKSYGGEVVGVASLVDRSTEGKKFTEDLFSLYKKEIVTYNPENCPLCQQGIPITKPGSRNFKS
ncbi:orotate phosphoribosyltransferase [Anaerobranca californiensis DSM 14826]|uniref:Orotate phosphoribosyltransferase n=1 Tax=Anaerobranca californiensis DSM 14826 TaxID=1120989 RepID=A0A1M6LG99_9FIRM|nr:orotate phosphoribosyltransferase [Anaerobranca californiensis]SHJ70244.1 orotate phosphoribosyltransferase [Anaerobranca californiensis DSM 14826]